MKAETKQKLKPFVTVAVASVVTLAVYLLSSVVLVAIFREIEDKTLRALINAVIVTAAFGFILLYIAKIRNSAGEDEAISDCGARDGIPLAEELRQYRTIRRTRLDGSFCACYDVEIALFSQIATGDLTEKCKNSPVFLRFLSQNRHKNFSAIHARELCGIALKTVLKRERSIHIWICIKKNGMKGRCQSIGKENRN